MALGVIIEGRHCRIVGAGFVGAAYMDVGAIAVYLKAHAATW